MSLMSESIYNKLVNEGSASLLIQAYKMSNRLGDEPPSKYDLQGESEYSSYAGAVNVLNDFEERGLIEFEPVARSHKVSITDKGERVASALIQLRDRCEEVEDDDK